MEFKWTDEQVAFLDCDDDRIRIRAFAGAAKTTSLVGYTKLRPHKKFLYLAFNKAIEKEAKGRFPKNVETKTTHALAYAAFGRDYAHKLSANLRLKDVASALGSHDWAFVKTVAETVNNFITSADHEIGEKHLPEKSKKFRDEQPISYLNNLFASAELIWSKMIDKEDKEVSMLHDGYLKVYSLSNPDLSRYHSILVDEAQDQSPVSLTVMTSQQHSQLIFCGDSHQSIYGFRNACDALEHPDLAGSTDLSLSSSFRFGPAVATVANILLAYKGETKQIKGAGFRTQIKQDLPPDAKCPALIHRTVMGVITSALEAAGAGKKVYWVGGIDAYQIANVEDLQHLSANKKDAIQNPTLAREYSNYGQYKAMAEESNDPEMRRAVNIISSFDNLPERLKNLRKLTVKKIEDADVLVTTAHRSKGLEFPFVKIMDDFVDPMEPNIPLDKRAEEINLLYLAVTRAIEMLALNQVAIGMMREYYTRIKNGLPIPTGYGSF